MLQSVETVVINETVLAEVVKRFEFPKEYVVRCLNNNELNYATTSYWLLANPNVLGLNF